MGRVAKDTGAEVVFPDALDVVVSFEFVTLFWWGLGEVDLEEVGKWVPGGVDPAFDIGFLFPLPGVEEGNVMEVEHLVPC